MIGPRGKDKQGPLWLGYGLESGGLLHTLRKRYKWMFVMVVIREKGREEREAEVVVRLSYVEATEDVDRQ